MASRTRFPPYVSALVHLLESIVARGEVLLLDVGYGVHLTSDGLVALNAQGIAVQGTYTDWHAWSDCPLAIDNVYQPPKTLQRLFGEPQTLRSTSMR